MERVTHCVLRSERRASLVGLQMGAGALAVLAATIVGAMLPSSSGGSRMPPVVAGALPFRTLGADLRAAVSAAALRYLMITGFLVDRVYPNVAAPSSAIGESTC